MAGLKPEVSIGVGMAAAALAVGVYVNATPTVAEMRLAPAGQPDLAASRKVAVWTSAAAVAAVSLIARDATVFIIGGSTVVAWDWITRHAIEVDPRTGKVSVGESMAATKTSTQDSDPGAFGYADAMGTDY